MAMNDPHAAIDALLRNDLKAYLIKVFETVAGGRMLIDGWHLDAIVHQLNACYRGDVKRLIITLPPRHLKSICTSVAFPTWLLGQNPSIRIIGASYSDDLATGFSRDRRMVLQSDWYRRAFPKTRIGKKDKNTEREIHTSHGGRCIAASVEGTLTGKGGNFIIIDDPIKAGVAMSEAERNSVNNWYRNTVYTRLDDKNRDVIVIVMQRVHVDDLVGHVIDLDDWTVLNLPAIAQEDQEVPIGDGRIYDRREGDILHPERESYDTLMKAKEILGSGQFAAQYLQTPIPAAGNTFKRSWFRRYPNTKDVDEFAEITQSWDTAAELSSGASYSVCTTWGILEARTYLLHVARDRWLYPDLKAMVVSHARAWGARRVLIEQASSGISLLQDLRGKVTINFIPIKPKLDKQVRAEQSSAVIEAGRVFLPDEAEWLSEFEAEVFASPETKHSDQVDSMSQFLRAWELGGPRIIEVRGSLLGGRSTYYDRMGGVFP
ncbi:MAG: phage terminase large subunit [Rhodospirillales bacterium]|nr:phage terminase large subunit [Rhodospirillales bacterium]